MSAENRGLPPIAGPDGADWRARREEILRALESGMYGVLPSNEPSTRIVNIKEGIDFAGKALAGVVTLACDLGEGSFQFPVCYAFPLANAPAPVFVHINFRPEVPDRYLPAEEILDNGFGFAQFCYTDVVNDRYHGDFSDGAGKALYNGRARGRHDAGKIALWAYAAMRVIDWLETRPQADPAHFMVVGHSRLGKTAIWAGALDERVYATFSNDSGAGGAAIMRGKKGERIADFERAGIWDWFADDYRQWTGREGEMPFDQHMALALIAPRLLCVGSAEKDDWSDPESEFLACREASIAWHMCKKRGLIAPSGMPEVGKACFDGEVGYHLRAGTHFFSRSDWLRCMDFAKRHIEI